MVAEYAIALAHPASPIVSPPQDTSVQPREQSKLPPPPNSHGWGGGQGESPTSSLAHTPKSVYLMFDVAKHSNPHPAFWFIVTQLLLFIVSFKLKPLHPFWETTPYAPNSDAAQLTAESHTSHLHVAHQDPLEPKVPGPGCVLSPRVNTVSLSLAPM